MTIQVVRYICVSIIGTSINYFGGVLLSDVLGFRYYIAGIIVLPLSFFVGFFLNKYWVFKHEKA
ncbi:MAG: GtrA family protein [Candidatus Andersenbacteria bacterium]|nr:GtrA family protein [Candidatus Andersenbacteria bacterium]